MNAKFPSNVADLKDEVESNLGRLKEAAQEKVIDPVVHAARDGAAKAAEYGRHATASADRWVGDHPYPTAGLTFLAGVLLGVVLGRHSRW